MIEQILEGRFSHLVADTLHSFFIRDPDATGHDVWDYAWALHLEQISGHSFDKYRTASCIAFRGLWLGDSTDAVVRKYIDGLTLRAARGMQCVIGFSEADTTFPQGWGRQHDPQRRHGKTFVAVLAIDAALRRHPDKKVAFGVRTNGASAPLSTPGHYSRASPSCARQLECCGRAFIGGVISKKKSHRSRTLFYCALFIV